jgi:hypothetical protein
VFIWFAENLGTFAPALGLSGAGGRLELVSPAKLGAWYLLMYISFVLVASVHGAAGDERRKDDDLHRGQCLCGQVSFTIDAEPLGARMCWCRDCQRIASGRRRSTCSSPRKRCATRRDDHAPADRRQRQHRRARVLPACGAQMYSKTVEPPACRCACAPGTLDDPELMAPTAIIWAASAPSWAPLDPSCRVTPRGRRQNDRAQSA